MRTRLIPAVMLLSIFCSLILFAQEKPAISPEDAAKLPYAVSLAGVEDSGTGSERGGEDSRANRAVVFACAGLGAR